MLRAFDTLPGVKWSLARRMARDFKGEVETIALDHWWRMHNVVLSHRRTAADAGEMLTEAAPVLDFLLMLCSVGQHYPGFETDIQQARNETKLILPP